MFTSAQHTKLSDSQHLLVTWQGVHMENCDAALHVLHSALTGTPITRVSDDDMSDTEQSVVKDVVHAGLEKTIEV